jgi:allantoin racemase
VTRVSDKARPLEPTRIWLQSLTDLSTVGGYAELLTQQAEQTCLPSTVVDVHGVPAGTYPAGVAPISVLRYPWIERLLSDTVGYAALQAEREGYDAVAVSCFFDPALDEARSLVDIPVVSGLESSLVIALSVSRRVGLLTLDDRHSVAASKLVGHYGLADRLACVVPLSPHMTELELVDPANSGQVLANLVGAASEAATRGAEVVIPAEGVLNATACRDGRRDVAGVPVINGIAAILAHAEMLVQLRRTTGLVPSRLGAYEKPPRDLAAHFEANP